MVQVHAKTCAPSAHWTSKALRHLAAVCLLLGWGAFLLVATLQPCCRLVVAQTHLISASAGVQSTAFDHHGGTDHHPSDSSKQCVDITIATGVALAAVERPFCGENATHACHADGIQEWDIARRLNYTIPPHLPPPRPIPLYLRTSRILI